MSAAASPWRPIDDIPVGQLVEVETVHGVTCLAKTRRNGVTLKGPDIWGPRRAHCIRNDTANRGDVAAVKWRAVRP